MSVVKPEQRFGKYRILGELGRGGFATVYRAVDTSLRREVALKILHPALVSDPSFIVRFENDARATAQLDHPHIVAIYEYNQIEGRLYIAMQLLPGGTLTARIQQHGPFSFVEAMRIVGEVAEALDHAHTAGFIHRDVKPTNILFNSRDQAVLADFGLVKAVESSVIARSSMGNTVGTPPYIAPEVWEGKDDGPWTDVYALGCVFFEMLTGQVLFKGNTPPAVMRAHFQPRQYPEHWPEGVPREFEAVLEQALASDPAKRYQRPMAFWQALNELEVRETAALAAQWRAKLPKPTSSLFATLAPAPTAAGGGETIVIVSSLSRTGSSKGQTDTIVNAIKQRLEEANYQACNGKFTIEYRDWDNATAAKSQWDKVAEASNANKAAADTDVMIYIGTFNSGATKISIPILNAANVVIISPANTYTGLTKAGKGVPGEPDNYYPNGKRNYTRVVPADDVQGTAGANWAKELGLTSVFVIDDTQLYGKVLADSFDMTAKAIGINVVGRKGINGRAADYRVLAAKIVDLNPDLVYYGGITQNNSALFH